MTTWVQERDVFADHHDRLAQAVSAAGGQVMDWDDSWLQPGRMPTIADPTVIYHGCLGNAAAISQSKVWEPGAWCTVDNFRCSAWYELAKDWVVHRQWIQATVRDLVQNTEGMLGDTIAGQEFFVRPDSPLKPFSGRVHDRGKVTLRALDHGFYYDDEDLAVIVASVIEVGCEWRFVVVDRTVVAGSAYQADGRTEAESLTAGYQWDFAQEIAQNLPAPDPVYVLDLCEVQGQLRLLELNPFSGADLYACDRASVVDAVHAFLERRTGES